MQHSIEALGNGMKHPYSKELDDKNSRWVYERCTYMFPHVELGKIGHIDLKLVEGKKTFTALYHVPTTKEELY